MVDFFVCKKRRTRGTLGYIRNRKTEEKIVQNCKTAKKFGQNRKPHLLSKQENPKTTLDNKTEKPLLFSTKTENRMLKIEKSANRNEHQNRKTEVFYHKNQNTDLKNSQNRKSQCPPQERLVMHEIMRNSRNHVSCTQDLEITHAFKKLKKSKLFENLNDAYVISMPKFATWK